MKNTEYTPVLHFLSSFEGASYKNYEMQLPLQLLFYLFLVVFYQLLHQQILFFTNFRTPFNLVQKIFLS